MKIFIIGRFEEYEPTKQKFHLKATELRSFGYEVVDPLDHLTGEKDWFESSGETLKYMLDCDSIFLLSDWNKSPIAKLCFYLSMHLKFDIFMEHDLNWLQIMSRSSSIAKLPCRKIHFTHIEKWLNEKIENCRDNLSITEAMNEKRKETHWRNELENFIRIQKIIQQKSTILQ